MEFPRYTRGSPSGRASHEHSLRFVQSLGRQYAGHLFEPDSLPCPCISDPAASAPTAIQIAVTEEDRAQRDKVQASLDLIRAGPTISVVLNKVQMSTPPPVGAYSDIYAC